MANTPPFIQTPFNYRQMPRSLRDIVVQEGVPYSASASTTASVGTGGVNVNMGAAQVPCNHSLYADFLSVGSNSNLILQIFPSYGGTTGGIQGTSQDTFQVSIGANGNLIFPIGKLLTSSSTPSTTGNQVCSVSVRRLRNADGTDATVANTNVQVGFGASGYLVYDDQNYSADKIIKFVGDSIFNGVGRTFKRFCYDWKLRSYYSDTVGMNVRGIMKAVSGSTSSQHETWRQSGWHDEFQTDLLVYELGTNDAIQAVQPATFRANLDAFIAFKKSHYPNAKMLVLGALPIQNVTHEAAAVLLRTQASQAVTAAADSSIKFCDLGLLGSTFSAVNANYAASDGIGTGVHPSDQGDAYIWNGNVSAGGSFTGLQAFLATNIPTF